MKMITDLQDDVVTPNVMQLGDGPLTDIGVEPGSVLRDEWDGVSDAITMQAQSAERERKMQQLVDVAFAKAGDKEAAKRVESDALLGWALTAEAAADAENTEDVLGTQLARRYGTGDPGAVWDAMNASADYEYEQMPAWNTRAEGMRLVWGRFQKMVQGRKAAADAAQAAVNERLKGLEAFADGKDAKRDEGGKLADDAITDGRLWELVNQGVLEVADVQRAQKVREFMRRYVRPLGKRAEMDERMRGLDGLRDEVYELVGGDKDTARLFYDSIMRWAGEQRDKGDTGAGDEFQVAVGKKLSDWPRVVEEVAPLALLSVGAPGPVAPALVEQAVGTYEARKNKNEQVRLSAGVLRAAIDEAMKVPEGGFWQGVKNAPRVAAAMAGDTLPYLVPVVGAGLGTADAFVRGFTSGIDAKVLDAELGGNQGGWESLKAMGNAAMVESGIQALVELMPWGRVGGKGLAASVGRKMKAATGGRYVPGALSRALARGTQKSVTRALVAEFGANVVTEGLLEPIAQGALTLTAEGVMDLAGVEHGQSKSFAEAFAELGEIWEPEQLAGFLMFSAALTAPAYGQARKNVQLYQANVKKFAKNAEVWETQGLSRAEAEEAAGAEDPLERGNQLVAEGWKNDPAGMSARLVQKHKELKDSGRTLVFAGVQGNSGFDADTVKLLGEAWRASQKRFHLPEVELLGDGRVRLTRAEVSGVVEGIDLTLTEEQADAFLFQELNRLDMERMRDWQKSGGNVEEYEGLQTKLAGMVDVAMGDVAVDAAVAEGRMDVEEMGKGLPEELRGLIKEAGGMNLGVAKKISEWAIGQMEALEAGGMSRAEAREQVASADGGSTLGVLAGMGASMQKRLEAAGDMSLRSALNRRRGGRRVAFNGRSVLGSVLVHARGGATGMNAVEDVSESVFDMMVQGRTEAILENQAAARKAAGEAERPATLTEARAAEEQAWKELAEVASKAREALLKVDPDLAIEEVNGDRLNTIEALSTMAMSRYMGSGVLPRWMSGLVDVMRKNVQAAAAVVQLQKAMVALGEQDAGALKDLLEFLDDAGVQVGKSLAGARVEAVADRIRELARWNAGADAAGPGGAGGMSVSQAQEEVLEEEDAIQQNDRAREAVAAAKPADAAKREDAADREVFVRESAKGSVPGRMKGVFVGDAGVYNAAGDFWCGEVDKNKLSDGTEQVKVGEKGKHGVIAGKELTGRFVNDTAPILVWKRRDGPLQVISGRHRFAKLMEDESATSIMCYVYEESAERDEKWARMKDFEQNMRDDQADEVTCAVYARETGLTEAEMRERGLTRNGSRSKRGIFIGQHAREELWTRFRNGEVKPMDAELVCKLTAALADQSQVAEIQAHCCGLLKAGKSWDYIGASVQLMASSQAQQAEQTLLDLGADFTADLEKMARWVELCRKAFREAIDLLKDEKRRVKKGAKASRLGLSATMTEEKREEMLGDLVAMDAKFEMIGSYPELVAEAKLWDGDESKFADPVAMYLERVEAMQAEGLQEEQNRKAAEEATPTFSWSLTPARARAVWKKRLNGREFERVVDFKGVPVDVAVSSRSEERGGDALRRVVEGDFRESLARWKEQALSVLRGMVGKKRWNDVEQHVRAGKATMDVVKRAIAEGKIAPLPKQGVKVSDEELRVLYNKRVAYFEKRKGEVLDLLERVMSVRSVDESKMSSSVYFYTPYGKVRLSDHLEPIGHARAAAALDLRYDMSDAEVMAAVEGLKNAQGGYYGSFSVQRKRDLTLDEERVTKKEAWEHLEGLAGKPLRNARSKFVAVVNKPQRKELTDLSKAWKSANNGFSIAAHYAAVSRLEKLFEHAVPCGEYPDLKHGEQTVHIRRFACPLMIDGEKAVAWLTAKLTTNVEGSERLYNLELVDIEKLAGNLEYLASHRLDTALPAASADIVAEVNEAFKTYFEDVPNAGSNFSASLTGGKNLAAVHSIPVDTMLDVEKKLGGLPKPSIAITRLDKPYSWGYSERVYLIGKPELADPQKGNLVYDRDAWTGKGPFLLEDGGAYDYRKGEYFEPTLEEFVARTIKKKGQEDGSSFRGQSAVAIGTMDAVKAHREKLSDTDTSNAQKAETDEALEELIENVVKLSKKGLNEGAVAMVLARVCWRSSPMNHGAPSEMKTSRDTAKRILNELGVRVKDIKKPLVDSFMKAVAGLQNELEDYLESVPQRAVMFNEWEYAVMPESMKGTPGLDEMLERNGIKPLWHDGTEEGRRAALAGLVDDPVVSFSVIGRKAKTWDKYVDRAFAGRDDGMWRAEIDASQAKIKGFPKVYPVYDVMRKLMNNGVYDSDEYMVYSALNFIVEMSETENEEKQLKETELKEDTDRFPDLAAEVESGLKAAGLTWESDIQAVRGACFTALSKWKKKLEAELKFLSIEKPEGEAWHALVEQKPGLASVNSGKRIVSAWSGKWLDDVLDFPELYEAYPQLRNIELAEDFGLGLADASYAEFAAKYGVSVGKNEGRYPLGFINMNPTASAWSDERKATSLLLHEIQHAIQSIEGFAKGGNPKSARQVLKDKLESMQGRIDWLVRDLRWFSAVEIARDLLKEARMLLKYPNAWKRSGQRFRFARYGDSAEEVREKIVRDVEERYNEFLQDDTTETLLIDLDAYVLPHVQFSSLVSIEAGLAALDKAPSRKLAFRGTVAKKSRKLADLQKRHAVMKKVLSEFGYEPYELYLRLAGEIESRNVEHRMDWSADKRAAIPFNETLEYPGEALVTFSVQSVTADWKNALDKFVQNPPAAGSVEYRSDMYVCPTPAVMQMVGARAYDIVLSPDVLVKCLDENIVSGVGKTLKQLYPKEKRRHAITLGTMGQLPASLAEPVCIMVSDTPGCVEVVTELKEGADNILVAVQLNALREGSRVLKVNRIVSLYGKEHITNLLNHPCLYWDKAKARIWTGGGGLQSSTAPYPKRASGRKILKPADLVKYKEQHGMSFSMINPDVEALAGEVVAAGQGFRANLAFSNQIVKEMRDSLQRMKRLGSKSRTEREDAIAAMGTMVHVVKAAVAYLPKGYRFSVHPYLKKLEVLAELATTGNLELTAELNDFATRPIKEFVRVQQGLHDVVEMKGQGELESDMSVEELLKEYGEAKLTDAMERIMHRVAEQLRKHAKDKAVQKIEELVERLRPKKDKKTGKLKGGKMSADAYRDLDAVYEAMNMSAEELVGKLAVLNEKMNKPGISEDERMQVEGELMLYDQFGDLKGMSAEGAVEAYEALRQRVWFHRFEWENVMAERRAMRRAVVRRVVDGVGSVSENEYNAKKRRVKPVKRLRHLGDILAGLPAVLRGLHGYLPLRGLAQDLTLRANRAGEQLKAWESERWVALEALSRETMGKSWRLCMDDMHEVKPTGVAFDRPKYRTVSYRTDGLRVLLEMTPEERKTEMRKRREAGGKEAETVLTERDVEALAEKLVQLEAEVSDAESKRRKVPATIEVRYLEEMQHEENLELSRGEALYAILMYEQPTYTERMEAQGYTPEVIEGLRRFVGEGMLEFGYGLRELFAKQGDRVAAVYERVYGVPFPREENYFAARWDVTEVKGSPAEQLLAGMSGTPGAGKGWQKQRVNHDLELDMTKDALQVFLQATSLTDTWMATQDIVEDFKAWTRDKDFVKALTVLLGKDGYDNLIDWIRILEMGGVQDCLNMGAAQEVINGLYGSGAVAILGFRVQTLLKQVPAIFNGLLGAHDISTAEWFATLSRMKNRTAPMTFRKMLGSTLLENRMQGRAGELKGQAMRSGDMRSSMAEELLLASMLPMEWTDACCTAVSLVPVWNVYYQRAIEKNASVQEAERMAWEQTAEVANLSSQPIGWLNKSKIAQLRNPLVRTFFYMLSENTAKVAMSRAFWRGGKKKAAMRAWLVYGAANAAISALLDYLQGDPDKWEKGRWWEHALSYAFSALYGPLASVPGVGELVEAVGTGILNVAGHALDVEPLKKARSSASIGRAMIDFQGSLRAVEKIWEFATDDKEHGLAEYTRAMSTVSRTLAIGTGWMGNAVGYWSTVGAVLMNPVDFGARIWRNMKEYYEE